MLKIHSHKSFQEEEPAIKPDIESDNVSGSAFCSIPVDDYRAFILHRVANNGAACRNGDIPSRLDWLGKSEVSPSRSFSKAESASRATHPHILVEKPACFARISIPTA